MTHEAPGGQSDHSAGDLLRGVLADLAEDVGRRRAGALADEPDAVHQLRTTVRRLRNVLAAFDSFFDAAPAAGFAAVLASYGGLLGECRDLEVRAADARAALDALGLEHDLSGRLVEPLVSDHARAQAALVAWHDGSGPEELDTHLALWSTSPPLTDRADRRARKAARKAVRRQVRRVLARADDAAEGAEASDGSEEGRHDLRKAARRLRHTVDAVGGPAATGRLGQEIQGMLGDHRDALLLADHVRVCAAGVAGEIARAPYDRVVAYAEGVARGALAGLTVAVARLREEAEK